MTTNIYKLSEPVTLTIEIPQGGSVKIDVIVAASAIGKIHEELNTTEPVQTAEHFRPWLAQKMEIDVEDLAISQVIECVDLIIGMNNQAADEVKKKRETMLSSLSSSPESQETTENGQPKQETPGSTTTNSAKHGEAVWDS